MVSGNHITKSLFFKPSIILLIFIPKSRNHWLARDHWFCDVVFENHITFWTWNLRSKCDWPNLFFHQNCDVVFKNHITPGQTYFSTNHARPNIFFHESHPAKYIFPSITSGQIYFSINYCINYLLLHTLTAGKAPLIPQLLVSRHHISIEHGLHFRFQPAPQTSDVVEEEVTLFIQLMWLLRAKSDLDGTCWNHKTCTVSNLSIKLLEFLWALCRGLSAEVLW